MTVRKTPVPEGRVGFIFWGIFESFPVVNRSKLTEKDELSMSNVLKFKSHGAGFQVLSGMDSEIWEERILKPSISASAD